MVKKQAQRISQSDLGRRPPTRPSSAQIRAPRRQELFGFHHPLDSETRSSRICVSETVFENVLNTFGRLPSRRPHRTPISSRASTGRRTRARRMHDPAHTGHRTPHTARRRIKKTTVGEHRDPNGAALCAAPTGPPLQRARSMRP
eukprot:969588-Prymnesium_polylepis.1